MLIGIDIDEVLSETLDFALAYHLDEIQWIPLRREDFVDYYIPNIPGYEHISKTDAVAYFTDSMLYDAEHGGLLPVKGARDALEAGKKAGHRFVAITARGPKVQEATLRWIEKWYPGIFEQVVFCNYHDDSQPQFTKEEMCHELGVQLMVDDNLHYARALAKASIPVFLIDCPRNQAFDPENDLLITKVEDRSEIDFTKIP